MHITKEINKYPVLKSFGRNKIPDKTPNEVLWSVAVHQIKEYLK